MVEKIIACNSIQDDDIWNAIIYLFFWAYGFP